MIYYGQQRLSLGAKHLPGVNVGDVGEGGKRGKRNND